MKNILEALDIELASDKINHGEGHCFLYHVKDLGLYDRIHLFENVITLGPINNDHSMIRDIGGGIFSPWGDYLYFSSSDGSNPLTNGRRYRLSAYVTPEEEKVLKKPRTLHLNLTLRCNLHCRICRPEDFQPGTNSSLSKEVIDKVINEAFDSLTQLRLDSGGELLLSPHLPYVLQEATKRNIPMFISSNGTMMSREKAEMLCNSSLSNIQISLDSADKETLEWIRRGAKFEAVICGAENIVAARQKYKKTKPRIEFHAALLQQNLKQLPDLIRLAKKIGVDGVGVAYGYTHSHMDPEWSVFWSKEKCNEVIAEARQLAKELGVSFNGPASFNSDTYVIASPNRYCHYLFEWTYIQPTGTVSPCCIGSYELGDLNTTSFTDVWYGERYNELRQTYNTPAPSYPKCANCYITSVWNPEDYKAHFHPDHWAYIENKMKTLPKKQYQYCVYGEFVFPGEMAHWIEKIVKLQNNGDIEEAVKLIEETISNYPRVVDLYNFFAEILLQIGDTQKAKTILENVIQCIPENHHALNNLAVIEIEEKNFKKALELLKKVLAIRPDNKIALENIKYLKEQLEIVHAGIKRS